MANIFVTILRNNFTVFLKNAPTPHRASPIQTTPEIQIPFATF